MNEIVLANLDDVQRAAKLMLASGYFEAQRDPVVGVAQLAVKILAGREMGYGPFASVQGIHVIQGKPTLSANLMAAAVKSSPRYDYRVRQMTDAACRIEFFETIDGRRESVGESVFTLEDAKRAGVKNLDKFPRNMLFARAMSNGVRWYCPDVFAGNAAYTPEEMGDQGAVDEPVIVDMETGEILSPPQSTATDNPFTDDAPPPPSQASQPQPPAPAPAPGRGITEKQLKMLHSLGVKVYGEDGWKTKRPTLVEAVTRGERHSAADLTINEAKVLIDGLLARTQPTGNGNGHAAAESVPEAADFALPEPTF